MSFVRFPPLFTLLRAFLLAALAMGMVIKPVLSSLCEIHGLGHLLETHGHQHLLDGSDVVPVEVVQHKVDKDHAGGAHALLHGDDSSSVYADMVATIVLPVVAYEPLMILLPMAAPVPLQHVTGPFRPPIA